MTCIVVFLMILWITNEISFIWGFEFMVILYVIFITKLLTYNIGWQCDTVNYCIIEEIVTAAGNKTGSYKSKIKPIFH